jgi:large subunit ribosomal protein L1
LEKNAMPPRSQGKRYRAAKEKTKKPSCGLHEAVAAIKEFPRAKFDESVEVVMRLNVDPRQADQMVRGSVVLPKGTGKTVRVVVVASGEKVKDAESAGADTAGGKEIVEKIRNGWMEFDALVATPDMMGEVGKLGKLLGPRGLMPSPKTGTVTFNVKEAVQDLKAGKVNYKVDKAGNLQSAVGKISFSAADIETNVQAFVAAIMKDRPASVKGGYVRSAFLSTTMGPSVRLDVAGLESHS